MTDVEDATAKVDRDKSRYDNALRYLVGVVVLAVVLGLGAGLLVGIQLRDQGSVITEQGVAIKAILKTQTENSKTRASLISQAIAEIDKNQREQIADHDRKIELLLRRVVAPTKAEVQAPENQEGVKP